jgi:hypothetical protein
MRSIFQIFFPIRIYNGRIPEVIDGSLRPFWKTSFAAFTAASRSVDDDIGTVANSVPYKKRYNF